MGDRRSENSIFVAATLKHHPATRREVNPDVGAVELLLADERRIGDERLGFFASKVFVVVRALGAESRRGGTACAGT